MLDIEILKDYMNYRCSIYYWLKSSFIKEPTEEVLESIANTCREFVVEADTPSYEKEFISYFGKLDKKEIKLLEEEIRPEYARLFLGPKHIPAPPYESVYRTKNRQIFGDTAFEVKKIYDNFGVKIESEGNIPNDFIGYELEFMYYMAYLCEKLCEDEKNYKSIESIINYSEFFLREHLVLWIEDFSKDIIDNTNMEYFKILANFTMGYILEDMENLKELL